jgi:hypothetical protein
MDNGGEPPSPLQWLPEGHLAYFVLDLKLYRAAPRLA